MTQTKTEIKLSRPIVFATGNHNGYTNDDYCYIPEPEMSLDQAKADKETNAIYLTLKDLKRSPYFKKSAMNNTYFYKSICQTTLTGYLISVDLETGNVSEFWI